jgi:polyisoprenoid-binding protein YceI
MKTLLNAVLASFVLSALAFTAPKGGKLFVADVKKSTVTWLGKKVTGSHDGGIALSQGSIETDGKTISKGSFEIDMNSITCKDITDEGYNAKLIGHLKNDDFFATDKFPKATLVIKSAKAKGNGEFDVVGDLTIKNITQAVNFPANIKITGNGLVATAKVTVDRTKYDIKYGSGSFFDNLGDKAIDNLFTLDVNLVANAK